MVAKLKQMGLKQLECDFNYQNIETKDIEKHRQENSEHKVMLKILDRLLECYEKENDIKGVIEDIESDSSYDMSGDIVNQVSKNERLIRTLIDIVSENNATKKEYKVTEINLTGDVLADEVETYLLNSQLTRTHIDYKLFVKSVNNVSEAMKEKAKQWNVNDVKQLTKSDLIMYRDSHDNWNLNNEHLIKEFNEAINDNGFLILVVKYRLTEPEEAINSLLNNNNITISKLEKRFQTLYKLTIRSGLRLIARKSDSVSTMAMMFRKMTEKIEIPVNRDTIEVNSQRNEKWFEAIRQCLQESKDCLDAGQKPKPVWLIANDTNINGIIGLINCLRLEPGGQCLRCLFDMDSNIKLPIDWTANPFSDILINNSITNVIKGGKFGTYRHLRLPKDYDKTLSNEYFLNQSANKDLSNLNWFNLTKLTPSDDCHDWFGNPIRQVNVQIYASGLIFKDIMFATGSAIVINS